MNKEDADQRLTQFCGQVALVNNVLVQFERH